MLKLFRSAASSTAVRACAAAVLLAASAAFAWSRASADPSVPAHVLTLDYYCCSNGQPNLPPKAQPSDLAQYTTWMMITNSKYADSLAGAGMKVVFYTNPSRVGPKEPLYANDDSMFARDCNGNRISIARPATMADHYLTDPRSTVLQQRWSSYLSDIRRQGHIDAVFADSVGELSNLTAKPCNMNQAQWTDTYQDLIQTSPIPVLYNGLMDLPYHGNYEFELSPALHLAAPPNAMGGLFETCYTDPHRPGHKTQGSFWRQTENEQLYMARLQKIFICVESAQVSGPRKMMADQSIDLRQYGEASFLLTYDAKTSMMRQKFQNPSGFELDPETELVVLDPVVAPPNSVDSLKTSTGAYAREYRSCYIKGSPVGPCAAVVNSDKSSTVGFPFSNYHHTLELNGGGIMDGGTIDTKGPAPSDLGPMTGVVAFQ